MLGFTFWWYHDISDWCHRTSSVRRNGELKNCSWIDNYKLIDITIENEQQLSLLYQTMIQGIDNDSLTYFLEQRQFDRDFEFYAQQYGWKNCGKALKFENTTKPYSLFYQVWSINYADVE